MGIQKAPVAEVFDRAEEVKTRDIDEIIDIVDFEFDREEFEEDFKNILELCLVKDVPYLVDIR